MCTIGAKYLPKFGWVGFKNRDRNYHAVVDIRTGFEPLEKLYIWDMDTQYSEGMNEAGVSILLASLVMNEDEREIAVAQRCAKEGIVYSSPVGIKLRAALGFTTPQTAAASLIEQKTTGHILIFNEAVCLALEATINVQNEYEFVLTPIAAAEGIVVRSNHGIHLQEAGYQRTHTLEDRMSSEERRKTVIKALEQATTLEAVIEAFSTTNHSNKQFNPVRFCAPDAEKQTTGQLMLVPKKRALHYRPIMGGFVANLSSKGTSNIAFEEMPNFDCALLTEARLSIG